MDWSLALRAAQHFKALLHDAHRLAHLFHADTVSVVTVTVFADRNVKVEFGVTLVRLRFAQIPSRARSPHHHARKAPGPGFLKRHHADIDIALLENAVVG